MRTYCLTYADKLGVKYREYGDDPDALEKMAEGFAVNQPIAWYRVVRLADAHLITLWKDVTTL